MTFDEIVQQVQTLPTNQRKWLIKLLVDTLPDEPSIKQHSILEFRGVGAHLYDGTDAQEYVNELRREWDDRP